MGDCIIAKSHLAICASIIALRLAIDLHGLTIEPVLRAQGLVVAYCLAIRRADLLALYGFLTSVTAGFQAVRSIRALAFDPLVLGTSDTLLVDTRGSLDASLTLLAFHTLSLLSPGLPLLALNTLGLFDPRNFLAFDALRTLCPRLALDALGTLRRLALSALGPLRRLALSALGSLRTLCPLALRSLTAMFAIWLCAGRG